MSPPATRRRLIRNFAIAAAASLAALLAFLVSSGSHVREEALLGWLLAAANGGAHALICGISLSARPEVFLLFGVVMNALRMGVVLVILTLVCCASTLSFAPFAATLVMGTVLFLSISSWTMGAAGKHGNNT